MTRPARPRLLITMGDPAGIGPEIILRLFERYPVGHVSRPLVLGAFSVFERARRVTRARVALVHAAKPVADLAARVVPVCPVTSVTLRSVPFGRVSKEAGAAALACIEEAVARARRADAEGIVTAPISKESLWAAGETHYGHTDLIADRLGACRYRMMLVVGRVRVVHVTGHAPLKEALRLLTTSRVRETILVGAEALADLGLRRPRVGVLGLNPHAGEGGRLGTEEERILVPAIAAARASGVRVEGPFPPDTIFRRARQFDLLVALYHDQGHIPLKLMGFERGVNVTVGLPVVRTSVDHGTAFDIAGSGTADPRSLWEAVRLAARLARGRALRSRAGGGGVRRGVAPPR